MTKEKKQKKTWSNMSDTERGVGVLILGAVFAWIVIALQPPTAEEIQAEKDAPLTSSGAWAACTTPFIAGAKYGADIEYGKGGAIAKDDHFVAVVKGTIENAYGMDVAITMTCLVDKTTKRITASEYTHGH